jgi:hypothetical protein
MNLGQDWENVDPDPKEPPERPERRFSDSRHGGFNPRFMILFPKQALPVLITDHTQIFL